MTTRRFTKVFGQAIAQNRDLAKRRFTKVHGQALLQTRDAALVPVRRFTKTFGQVVFQLRVEADEPRRRFTKVFGQILLVSYPDFTWIDDMFKHILFPHDISLNSIASTRHESDDIFVDSGHSQRNARWEYPLLEFDVAYGVRTMEQLHALIHFNRLVRGTVYGFLYKDHTDFQSSVATRTEARAADPIHFLDQYLGPGGGLTYTFQLQKKYAVDDVLGNEDAIYRPITCPVRDSVEVGVGGVEVTNFTVDYNTGIVTFTTPYTQTFPGALGITARSGGQSTISGAAGTFFSANYTAGAKITMTGWAQTTNNIPVTVEVTIVSKAGDNSSITVTIPSGYGVLETGRTGVTIAIHPAPTDEVTAGYEFWVPVRFNTKRIPIHLEEYGIGGSNDVKLIEIRPGEVTP